MPNYEYICLTCNHRFELHQGISEPAIEICPECGNAVRRIITGGSTFVFKNSSAKAGGHTTACGSASPCCGRGEPCGKSHGCH